MSLYYEAADVLTVTSNTSGSLRARVFGKKELKSHPAQVYALAVESCKWSSVLKEVIENADLLRLERKLSPILALLLVHDLLLSKKGIALPATHGLRTAPERHKARLQAELTRARLRRKLSSFEDFRQYIEDGLEGGEGSNLSYPRWVRINSLRTTLEDQLDTTFACYERAATIDDVLQRGSKRVFLDTHVPNLIAVSPGGGLAKSNAYNHGLIIFQDKASCFPAYLLDPLAEDGDIIDTCAAPGNKTTHIAAILVDHASHPDECLQTIHAFEKDKNRAQTLEKMVCSAGSESWTKIYPGQDFLQTNPEDVSYRNVKALLLDPSCSGSGIVGRDEMPELHLPTLKQPTISSKKSQSNVSTAKTNQEALKWKQEDPDPVNEVVIDDDGVSTVVTTSKELEARLIALSTFQLQLLLHAFKFPSAMKITYSTCSTHVEENESVVEKALASDIARARSWRVLKRDEQIRGMREWPVRGLTTACGDAVTAAACIRANKGDEHCTMGFFVVAFVRDETDPNMDDAFIRDERGHLVRDAMGFPVRRGKTDTESEINIDDDEWEGFEDHSEGGTGAKQVVSRSMTVAVAVVAEEEQKDSEPVIARTKRQKGRKGTWVNKTAK